MVVIIEHLRSINASLEDNLEVGIVEASIDAAELIPVTASIRNLVDAYNPWEATSSRFKEESVHLKPSKDSARAHAAVTAVQSAICKKTNHTKYKFFPNPISPHSQIEVPK